MKLIGKKKLKNSAESEEILLNINLHDKCSFECSNNIVPSEENIQAKSGKVEASLEPYSLNVMKLKIIYI
ncbi:hypothetical protein [Christiangramia forsetii]|nr:hypothetical protein [Christiangramia forsetii]GGG37661.1 hypothetical protein GCM10011532_21660 [Christiangramia forsetii]